MKINLEKTTVKDISYLIDAACLRAEADTSLEKLAHQLCASDHYKVYLEDTNGKLTGVVQAKQIATKILELSRQKADAEEMLPAIAYVLNYFHGKDLSEPAVFVNSDTPLKKVIELMSENSIREIPVVDQDHHLVGTLEAKNILAQYLQAKAEAEL